MSHSRIWTRLLITTYWAFPLAFTLGFYQLYAPQTLGQWSLCFAQLIPWLACAPFVHRQHRKGLLWFSLLGLVYLLFSLIGVQAAWPQRLWPLLDASLLTVSFIIIMGYLRQTNPRRQVAT